MRTLVRGVSREGKKEEKSKGGRARKKKKDTKVNPHDGGGTQHPSTCWGSREENFKGS